MHNLVLIMINLVSNICLRDELCFWKQIFNGTKKKPNQKFLVHIVAVTKICTLKPVIKFRKQRVQMGAEFLLNVIKLSVKHISAINGSFSWITEEKKPHPQITCKLEHGSIYTKHYHNCIY